MCLPLCHQARHPHSYLHIFASRFTKGLLIELITQPPARSGLCAMQVAAYSLADGSETLGPVLPTFVWPLNVASETVLLAGETRHRHAGMTQPRPSML